MKYDMRPGRAGDNHPFADQANQAQYMPWMRPGYRPLSAGPTLCERIKGVFGK